MDGKPNPARDDRFAGLFDDAAEQLAKAAREAATTGEQVRLAQEHESARAQAARLRQGW